VDWRTVGKYIKQSGRPQQPLWQRWSTFIRNHANAIVACDFFTSVAATFQVLYVFVAVEIGSRRVVSDGTEPRAQQSIPRCQLRALHGTLENADLMAERSRDGKRTTLDSTPTMALPPALP
jgi:putative transposase